MPMPSRVSVLTIILAPTEQEARALIPPAHPGWQREVSVEHHPGICFEWRVQVQEGEPDQANR